MTSWSRITAATSGILLVTALAAGCGSDSDSSSGGLPTVVASTDVWGSIASSVGGDKADVTALITSASGDPHEFEANAQDTAKVADADIVVINGGHYDSYMEEAPKADGAIVVNAFEIFEGDEHGAEHDVHADESAEDGHESEDAGHEGHDHGAENEHVFYDLTVAGQVADAVANALGEKDDANKQFYEDNAKKFNEQIDELQVQLAGMKTKDDGARVAQTEPLAGYLLDEAGLADVAPAGLQDALEAGSSPSARDVATMQDLLRNKEVRAFIYNTQAVNDATEAMLPIAQSAGVPVVQLTETLPEGVTDFIAWQQGNITALQTALGG